MKEEERKRKGKVKTAVTLLNFFFICLIYVLYVTYLFDVC